MYSDGMKYFKDRFFLVTHFNEEAHAKIYYIDIESEYRCTNLFRKFRSQSHLLIGNEKHVYKEDDLSH